ncbi:MAG: hypothetical protein AMJ53_13105, partial [Gammaproteobacteria bacterium SG8_11]
WIRSWQTHWCCDIQLAGGAFGDRTTPCGSKLAVAGGGIFLASVVSAVAGLTLLMWLPAPGKSLQVDRS